MNADGAQLELGEALERILHSFPVRYRPLADIERIAHHLVRIVADFHLRGWVDKREPAAPRILVDPDFEAPAPQERTEAFVDMGLPLCDPVDQDDEARAGFREKRSLIASSTDHSNTRGRQRRFDDRQGLGAFRDAPAQVFTVAMPAERDACAWGQRTAQVIRDRDIHARHEPAFGKRCELLRQLLLSKCQNHEMNIALRDGAKGFQECSRATGKFTLHSVAFDHDRVTAGRQQPRGRGHGHFPSAAEWAGD